MPTATPRRKRRTPEEMIADLEAQVAAVTQRTANRNDRPRPEFDYTLPAAGS
jgi:hypothetical protein